MTQINSRWLVTQSEASEGHPGGTDGTSIFVTMVSPVQRAARPLKIEHVPILVHRLPGIHVEFFPMIERDLLRQVEERKVG